MNSREHLKSQVMVDSQVCDGCNRCFHACQLPGHCKTSARTVLKHLPLETPPAGLLEKFVLACTACGRCQAHCPRGLRPDLMLRWEKAKYKAMPYSKFMRVRGAGLNLADRATVFLHNFSRQKRLGLLSRYVDNEPIRAPLLFYFSCYLFSPTGVAADTLELADRLGLKYSVLGGMRHCCGYVHRLAGQLEKADAMYGDLALTLKNLGPQTIVTGCAECYRGLEEIVAHYDLEAEVISSENFALRHWQKLGLPARLPGKVAYHHGCLADAALWPEPEVQSEANRLAIGCKALTQGPAMSDVLDVVPLPGHCCGMAAGEYDLEYSTTMRLSAVTRARELSCGCLLVDCVSCREKFLPFGRQLGINVTDLISLVSGYLKRA